MAISILFLPGTIVSKAESPAIFDRILPATNGLKMAWFANHYECDRCKEEWIDEWSCMCDDDCPHCGARHMSPYRSDDLTSIVEKLESSFFVLWSPDTAEHDPEYLEYGPFQTRASAETFLVAFC